MPITRGCAGTIRPFEPYIGGNLTDLDLGGCSISHMDRPSRFVADGTRSLWL